MDVTPDVFAMVPRSMNAAGCVGLAAWPLAAASFDRQIWKLAVDTDSSRQKEAMVLRRHSAYSPLSRRLAIPSSSRLEKKYGYSERSAPRWPAGVAGGLHDGATGGPVAAHEQGNAEHAFIADPVDFRGAAVFQQIVDPVGLSVCLRAWPFCSRKKRPKRGATHSNRDRGHTIDASGAPCPAMSSHRLAPPTFDAFASRKSIQGNLSQE